MQQIWHDLDTDNVPGQSNARWKLIIDFVWRIFYGQVGRGFFRFGRPHFLVQA